MLVVLEVLNDLWINTGIGHLIWFNVIKNKQNILEDHI